MKGKPKKILSVLMLCCLLFSMVPAIALAENGDEDFEIIADSIGLEETAIDVTNASEEFASLETISPTPQNDPESLPEGEAIPKEDGEKVLGGQSTAQGGEGEENNLQEPEQPTGSLEDELKPEQEETNAAHKDAEPNEEESSVNPEQGDLAVSPTDGLLAKIAELEEASETNQGIVAQMLSTIADHYAGSDSINDWNIIGLYAYGEGSRVSETAKVRAREAALDTAKAKTPNILDLERAVLVLSAMGDDPRQLADGEEKSYNLIEKIAMADGIGGINGASYALLAYDAKDYEVPENQGDIWTREKLIETILNWQHDDGGWSLNTNPTSSSDADVTAIVLLALSPYAEAGDGDVLDAVEAAVDYLALVQRENGGYYSFLSGENANTAATVTIALAAMGIDAHTDARFIKGEEPVSLLENLLSYRTAENTFGFMDTNHNQKATEQGFLALIAWEQLDQTGDPFHIYDFTDGSDDLPEQSKSITLRVEGMEDNILYAKGQKVSYDTEDLTVLTAVEKILTENKIPYMAQDGYISSINQEAATMVGEEYLGWQYMVNDTLPTVGMRDYSLEDGDTVVLYYGGFSTLYPLVNEITYQEDGSVRIEFVNKGLDWNTGETVVTPIAGATVTWSYGDNEKTTYTTNEQGEVQIAAEQAAKGDHGVQIQQYSDTIISQGKKMPLVVRLADDYTLRLEKETPPMQSKSITLRVEGMEDNILYAKGQKVSYDTEDLTVLTAVEKILTENKIPYMAQDGYISSINQEAATMVGEEYLGWQYMVNDTLPTVGMRDYSLEDGDTVVLYYGGFSTLYPLVNEITYQEDGSVRIEFVNKGLDWNTGETVVTPIAGATVTWSYGDNEKATYTTNEQGEVQIAAEQVAEGDHGVQIQQYSDTIISQGKKMPLVVRLADDYTVSLTKPVIKSKTVNLRVEGMAANILDVRQVQVPYITDDLSVLDAVTYILQQENIDYVVKSGYGDYIAAINGEVESTFGEPYYDGWQYMVNGVLPSVGMSAATVADGDKIVLYYGDMSATLYPEVKVVSYEKGVATLAFVSHGFDWSVSPAEPLVVPIVGATVTWGYGANETAQYTTDSKGEIVVPEKQAAKGEHRVQIEQYSSIVGDTGKKLPLVVRLPQDYSVTLSSGSSGGGSGTDNRIKVTFRLIGDAHHEAGAHQSYVNWIKTTSYQMPAGSNMYDVFNEALSAAGLDYNEKEGYIDGITSPFTGEMLSEFDNGPNSGWIYYVNGIMSSVGIRDYKLAAGDVIIWTYVDDWIEEEGRDTWQEAEDVEPSASGSSSGSASLRKDSNATVAVIEMNALVEKNNQGKVNITEDQMTEAVKALEEEKTGIVEIKVKAADAVTSLAIEMPATAFGKINEKKNTIKGLTFTVPWMDMTLDEKAIQAIADMKSNDKVLVTLTKEKAAVFAGEQPLGEDGFVYQMTVKIGEMMLTQWGDGLVTGSIPWSLPEGQAPDNLQVYRLTQEGQWIGHDVFSYDAEKSRMYFTLQELAPIMVGASISREEDVVLEEEEALPFQDIINHEAKEDILFVVDKGLFSGLREGTFGPDDAMTRGMMVTVLGKHCHADTSISNGFLDVAEGQYYTPYVAWAAQKGIVKGFNEQEFAPNEALSREQLAVIMMQYAQFINVPLGEANDMVLADESSMSDWARAAVHGMQATGIMTAGADHCFEPQRIVTRAEAATTMRNFIAYGQQR